MKVLAKINGGWYVYDSKLQGDVNLPTKLQYQAEELYVEDYDGTFKCLKNRYDRETPMSKEEALFTILKASPLNITKYTINASYGVLGTG